MPKAIRYAKRPFPFLVFLLWMLVLIETAWLALFIWESGSLLPRRRDPSAQPSVKSAQPAPGPKTASESEDEHLRKMLEAQGSKGKSELPPPPLN